MYYLKNRYYDPEIRRFICADKTGVAKESMETLHNRNLYVYCDGNPLTRRDGDGEVWLAAALSFVGGAVASVAEQMIFDKKSLKEVSWIAAGTSGLTTAMGIMGIAPCIQIVIDAVGTFACSYIDDGESIKNSVINVAVTCVVDGGVAYLTRHSNGLLNAGRNYTDRRIEVKRAELSSSKEMKNLDIEGRIYKKNRNRIITTNVEWNVLSSATKRGTNKVVQKIKPQKQIPVRRRRDFYDINDIRWTVY